MENNKCEREQVKKIKEIIEREIEKELISKQDEVTKISEKIKTVLRNLELLKYIVAVNYYDQNTTLAPKKNQEDENEEEKTQNQIHPCIKKLMPFRSNYNKSYGDTISSHSYTTRNTKKFISNELSADVSNKEVNKYLNDSKEDNGKNNSKIPQYIPPLPSADENLIKVNSGRGSVSKETYRIVIGNVSKWIPPDTREGNSTHKWMVYIRTKDSEKDVTKQLRKVRYFLHESYKPHDIIDVTSHPFHLTRRGWGEFPVRVQLHFLHPLNKPVDIIHNLKLDMTCSGVQMLGAETVVNVSLHQSSIQNTKEESKIESEPKLSLVKEENIKEKQDVFDGNLLTSLNGFNFNNCDIDIEQENNSGIIIKQEPEESEKIYNSKTEDYLANNNNSKYLLDRRKVIKTIEIEHNYMKTVENSPNKNINNFTDSILKLEVIKNQIANEKNSKNGVVLDSVHLNQFINKKNQDCLNKIELKGNRNEEEVFKNLKAVFIKLETDTQSKYSMKTFNNMYMVNIVQRAQATKLKKVESLIKWFIQRWPIVTKLSLDPFYKIIHPYSSPSEEEFLKYNIGKQRSAEWFRAKAIQKVLTSLKPVIPFEEDIWSTKQILLWSRHHGYSPLSFQKAHRTEAVETNEIRNKRLKLNESSSDSDESSWDIPDKKSKTSVDFVNGANMKDRKKIYKKSRRKESIEVFDRHKNYKNVNTCTELNDSQRFGCDEHRVLHCSDFDTEIEIVEVEKESLNESPSKKQDVKLTSVTTTPLGERLFNEFVCDTAKQIGVKIVEEELVPGVKLDSVSRIMSLSVANFLDELLRRSFSHAWMRNGERCPDTLEVNDVLATLIEHNHFDLFTNRGLGSPNSEKS